MESSTAMQINHIKVDNFKSLIDFQLDLAKFTCLIGLNSSGKSTVLQLFDFLSQQFKGDIESWLKLRNWSARDLNSQLSTKSNIDLTVLLTSVKGVSVEWTASFNRKELRCTRESVTWNRDRLLKVGDGQYTIGETPDTNTEISFSYQGSILSQIKDSILPQPLKELKTFFQQMHTLDLLSPEQLRQRNRKSHGGLGHGGQYLSAFLYELGPKERQQILTRLQKAYPQLNNLNVSSLKSGWKKLNISESFSGKKIPTEARHMSDGMLRMLAVFAHLSKGKSVTLLDEIENGINPELVEYLIDSLVESPGQVLVTTHSPLVLNFLNDDVAKKGVVYLYKDNTGRTRSIRFFDIPSMAEKLNVMGPGEAYEDTILTDLSVELADIEEGFFLICCW